MLITSSFKAIDASPGRVTVQFLSFFDSEDRELAGYDESVVHPLMDLDDADYECKVLNVMEENDEGDTSANVAYISRRTAMAVFITRIDNVTVTNDPQEIAVCQNPVTYW